MTTMPLYLNLRDGLTVEDGEVVPICQDISYGKKTNNSVVIGRCGDQRIAVGWCRDVHHMLLNRKEAAYIAHKLLALADKLPD